MISHKYKCIFIHIPKTAGSSINSFFHPGVKFHFEKKDYERLFGWCVERKIHMQHATSKQLLETNLVTEEQWETYYKFTFVRNPWDRCYSDFRWMKSFAGLRGSFKDYIDKKGQFHDILTDNNTNKFLGDHVLPQSDFFDLKGKYELDFIGRFENFNFDIHLVTKKLGIERRFDIVMNKSKNRAKDYSVFYTNSNKELVSKKYSRDIDLFDYHFEDKRYGLNKIKKYL